MARPRRETFDLAGTAFLLVLALVGSAQAADQAGEPPHGSWLTLLKVQLKEGYNCTYAEMLHWRHVPVGSEVSTEGRVRCIDRREYDFTRSREHEKFHIRLCQPAIC